MDSLNFPPFSKIKKVVCINNDGWVYMKKLFLGLKRKETKTSGPMIDEIVTVIGMHRGRDGDIYYNLLEWPDDPNGEGWQADCFAPVQETFQSISLEKVLEEETKLISVN